MGHHDYDAVGNPLPPHPTVVLINHDTASAAEILASALGDHHLATIVGTRSFGKGTFQEVLHLAAGGALDLTVGEYLTADGTSLAGKGITPDVRAVDDPQTAPDEGARRRRLPSWRRRRRSRTGEPPARAALGRRVRDRGAAGPLLRRRAALRARPAGGAGPRLGRGAARVSWRLVDFGRGRRQGASRAGLGEAPERRGRRPALGS